MNVIDKMQIAGLGRVETEVGGGVMGEMRDSAPLGSREWIFIKRDGGARYFLFIHRDNQGLTFLTNIFLPYIQDML